MKGSVTDKTWEASQSAASLLPVVFLQRLAGQPLSVWDIVSHNGRDTGDDHGKPRAAPEASSLKSHTSLLLHSLDRESHMANPDANEGPTGRNHTYKRFRM